MKLFKQILVLLTFIAGLTISANAQTHDNVQPAKPKTQLRKMSKANIREKPGVSKVENTSEKKASNEAIQEDKKTGSGSTAPAEKKVEKPGTTVPVNKTEQKSGDKSGNQRNEKMKEVRPVKKTGTVPAAK